MIEVINLTPTQNQQLLNTYGYISLGSFEFPDGYKETIYSSTVYYKATCKIGSRKFELIIIPGSYLSNQFIVLGDLTNIPGNLLVDQEELYLKLKEKFEGLIQISMAYQQDILDYWSLEKDRNSQNQIIQGTTSNSYIIKVDYDTKS